MVGECWVHAGAEALHWASGNIACSANSESASRLLLLLGRTSAIILMESQVESGSWGWAQEGLFLELSALIRP